MPILSYPFNIFFKLGKIKFIISKLPSMSILFHVPKPQKNSTSQKRIVLHPLREQYVKIARFMITKTSKIRLLLLHIFLEVDWEMQSQPTSHYTG